MPPSLTNLPVEVHTHILTHLRTSDRKTLRLLNTHFKDRTPLLITRVFLSANLTNVEVFRAIADQEDLRHGVTEIIWDDALFPEYDARKRDNYYERAVHVHSRETYEWHKGRIACFSDCNPAPQISLQSVLDFYKDLCEQQRLVRLTKADTDAFIHGLRRFPALKRVTITPAAHGHLYDPLYETPMIRGFPDGFFYPFPFPWPQCPKLLLTESFEPPTDQSWAKWQGLSIILKSLADHENNITELVLDTHGLPTGIRSTMFDEPETLEYQGLYNLISKPGFRRLDLVLEAEHGYEQENHKSCWKANSLRSTLSEAKDLEHVKLSTDVAPNINHDDPWDLQSLEEEEEIRLQRDIVPIQSWPKLQHLGLAGFYLRQDDLVNLLAAAPPSLRSVELSNLRFLGDGSYRSLLCDMRDQLDWPKRPVRKQLKVEIAVGNRSPRKYIVDRVVCVEDEVADFLYRGGSNAFVGDDDDETPNQITPGNGVERDPFNPGFERRWEGCDEEPDPRVKKHYRHWGEVYRSAAED